MEMKPLNIFQRCIRVWEESHPYNAAQILEIAGPADMAAITAAWNEALAASGLGNVRVVGKEFVYERAPHQEVLTVEPELGIEGFITRELNTSFPGVGEGHPETAWVPFRPFVVLGKGGVGGRSHHLGVIYQHWVADSISMRMLLREWFCRLHDPSGVTGQALHVPRGGFWRYFGPSRCGWNPVEGALSVAESMTHFSRARRIEGDLGPQRVKCSLHRLPDGMIDELLAIGRRRRFSMNDLFLAAMARACDQFGAPPRRSSRDLAMGTIVDLRAHSRENMDNTFGLFLGFTSLVVTADHLRDPDRLLTHIAAQNAAQKECRAAQISMLRMAAGYAQGKMLSSERLANFYRDYMPLFGGVSNVNMNRSWPARYHPGKLLDYIRVAPTGPMVPVVIAVTTLGNRFTFVLTRRESLVDDESAGALADAFIGELTARAKTG